MEAGWSGVLPNLVALVLLALPIVRGPIRAALWPTSSHGLAFSAHWLPPTWTDALVACGLDAAIGSHQREAMRAPPKHAAR